MNRMATEIRSVVKSADRVLDVFEVLAHKGRPLTHTELSSELGIPKSSLSQLLGNLVERRYLAFTPGANTYVLGEQLFHLLELRHQTLSLPALAQPLCERITRTTGESSSLNMLRDDSAERVCGANSTQPLMYSMSVGDVAPLYAVSSGKVLLAWMEADPLAAYLKRTRFKAITKTTITSASALRRELAQVREEGVAWSNEEYTPGIVGVAVPVLQDGAALAAFNIALPSVRDNPVQRRGMVHALKEAAVSLEKDLAAVHRASSVGSWK